MSNADNDESPYVFESPYVDALMDIGMEAIAQNAMAKEGGATRYGEGMHDQVNEQRLVTAEDWAQHIVDLDGMAWASWARASLVLVQGSESDRELADRLERLGAIVAMWLTDVNSRTSVGVEPTL